MTWIKLRLARQELFASMPERRATGAAMHLAGTKGQAGQALLRLSLLCVIKCGEKFVRRRLHSLELLPAQLADFSHLRKVIPWSGVDHCRLLRTLPSSPRPRVVQGRGVFAPGGVLLRFDG